MNTLYLIPTLLSENSASSIPEYITPIIEKCDVFIVENLKTARRFIKLILKEKDIDSCILIEMNKHKNYFIDEQELYLIKDKNIGLMSEAGAPCIADPGNKIVQLAHELNWKIVPLVGPSSILLALIGSGFNGQNFTFNGYLPFDAKERKSKILEMERLANKNITQIFMDTPYRNVKLLEELIQSCSKNTLLSISCNLTAQDEFISTKTIGTWKSTKIDIHKKPCIFVLGK
ncbi:MAG: SAM-dependent methyltransferase [Chitinophagales bacterium]